MIKKGLDSSFSIFVNAEERGAEGGILADKSC